MEMVKLESVEDWENLPLNKDLVKQPRFSEERENALQTGTFCFVLKSNEYIADCSLPVIQKVQNC